MSKVNARIASNIKNNDRRSVIKDIMTDQKDFIGSDNNIKSMRYKAKEEAKREDSKASNEALDPYALPGTVVKPKSMESKYTNKLLEKIIKSTDSSNFQASSIKYHEESLNYLKLISENTGKLAEKHNKKVEEMLQAQATELSELSKSIASGDIFGSAKNIGKNIVNKADNMGILSLMGTTMTMGSAFGGSETGGVSGILKSTVASSVENATLTLLSASLGMNTKNVKAMYNKGKSDLPGAIQMAINMASQSNNQTLKNMFGGSFVGNRLNISSKKSKDPNAESLWDVKSHTTLNEVIPETLAQILSTLKGTHEVIRYEHESGEYKTRTQLMNEISKKSIGKYTNNKDNITNEILRTFNNLIDEKNDSGNMKNIFKKSSNGSLLKNAKTGFLEVSNQNAFSIIIEALMTSDKTLADFAMTRSPKDFIKAIGISVDDSSMATLIPTANAMLELARTDMKQAFEISEMLNDFKTDNSNLEDSMYLKGIDRRSKEMFTKLYTGKISVDEYERFINNNSNNGSSNNNNSSNNTFSKSKKSSTFNQQEYEEYLKTSQYGDSIAKDVQSTSYEWKNKKSFDISNEMNLMKERIADKVTSGDASYRNRTVDEAKTRAALLIFDILVKGGMDATSISYNYPNISIDKAKTLGYPYDFRDVYPYLELDSKTKEYIFNEDAFAIKTNIRNIMFKAKKNTQRNSELDNLDIMSPMSTTNKLISGLFQDPKIGKLTGLGGGAAAGLAIGKLLKDKGILTNPKAGYVLATVGGLLGNMEKTNKFLTNIYGASGDKKNAQGISNQDIFMAKLTQKYIPALGLGGGAAAKVFKIGSKFGLPGMLMSAVLAPVVGGAAGTLGVWGLNKLKDKMFTKKLDKDGKQSKLNSIGDFIKSSGFGHMFGDLSSYSTDAQIVKSKLSDQELHQKAKLERETEGSEEYIKTRRSMDKLTNFKKDLDSLNVTDENDRQKIIGIYDKHIALAIEGEDTYTENILKSMRSSFEDSFRIKDSGGLKDISSMKYTKWDEMSSNDIDTSVLKKTFEETRNAKIQIAGNKIKFGNFNLNDFLDKVNALKLEKSKSLEPLTVKEILALLPNDTDKSLYNLIVNELNESVLLNDFKEALGRTITSNYKKTNQIAQNLPLDREQQFEVDSLLDDSYMKFINESYGGDFFKNTKDNFSVNLGNLLKDMGNMDIGGSSRNAKDTQEMLKVINSLLQETNKSIDPEDLKQFTKNDNSTSASGRNGFETQSSFKNIKLPNGKSLDDFGCVIVATYNALTNLKSSSIDINTLSSLSENCLTNNGVDFAKYFIKLNNLFNQNNISCKINLTYNLTTNDLKKLSKNKRTGVLILKNNNDIGSHAITIIGFNKSKNTITYFDPQSSSLTTKEMSLNDAKIRLQGVAYFDIVSETHDAKNLLSKINVVSNIKENLKNKVSKYSNVLKKPSSMISNIKDNISNKFSTAVNNGMSKLKNIIPNFMSHGNDNSRVETLLEAILNKLESPLRTSIVEDLTLPFKVDDKDLALKLGKKMNGSDPYAKKIKNLLKDRDTLNAFSENEKVQDALLNKFAVSSTNNKVLDKFNNKEKTEEEEGNEGSFLDRFADIAAIASLFGIGGKGKKGKLLGKLFGKMKGGVGKGLGKLGGLLGLGTLVAKAKDKLPNLKLPSAGAGGIFKNVANGIEDFTKNAMGKFSKVISSTCEKFSGLIFGLIDKLPSFISSPIKSFFTTGSGGKLLSKVSSFIKKTLTTAKITSKMSLFKMTGITTLVTMIPSAIYSFINAEKYLMKKDVSIKERIQIMGTSILWDSIPIVINAAANAICPGIGMVFGVFATGVLYASTSFEEFVKSVLSIEPEDKPKTDKNMKNIETASRKSDSGVTVDTTKKTFFGLVNSKQNSTYVDNEFLEKTNMKQEEIEEIVKKSESENLDARKVLARIGSEKASGNVRYNMDDYMKEREVSKKDTKGFERMISNSKVIDSASLKNNYKSPLGNNKLLITSAFGPRNVDGGSRLHQGIDLRAGFNTKIYAMKDGVVVGTPENDVYGSFKIKHGDGTISTYMHMSKNTSGLKKGDAVKAGQELGLAGKTGPKGSNYGPHLHLEVRKNGVPLDPIKELGLGVGNFKASEAENKAYIARMGLLADDTVNQAKVLSDLEKQPSSNDEKGGANFLDRFNSKSSEVRRAIGQFKHMTSDPLKTATNYIDDPDTRKLASEVVGNLNSNNNRDLVGNAIKTAKRLGVNSIDDPRLRSAAGNIANGSLTDIPGTAGRLAKSVYSGAASYIPNYTARSIVNESARNTTNPMDVASNIASNTTSAIKSQTAEYGKQIGVLRGSIDNGFSQLINELRNLLDNNKSIQTSAVSKL